MTRDAEPIVLTLAEQAHRARVKAAKGRRLTEQEQRLLERYGRPLDDPATAERLARRDALTAQIRLMSADDQIALADLSREVIAAEHARTLTNPRKSRGTWRGKI